MIHDLLFAIWFFLPAAIANAAPVFSAAIPLLKRFDAPIDGGATFRGKRVLGDHKTWRGVLSGIFAATLVVWGQQLAVQHFEWAKLLSNRYDYLALPALLVGILFTIGALGGDAAKSFFKRQLGIASGTSWFPFDQLDYIIGSLLVMLPVALLTPPQYAWVFLVWFVAHLAASYAGYLMGLKDAPI